jgi:hypothetical protein
MDESFDLKDDQCLANGRPRDTELFGEITLRGKTLAGGQLSLRDHRTNLIRHLPVQAAWFNSRKHLASPACALLKRTIGQVA